MRLFVVAWRETYVSSALVDAARRIGLDADVVTPPEAARRASEGDLVLSYLDVRPLLDGIEPGVASLRRLARRGVAVLRPRSAARLPRQSS